MPDSQMTHDELYKELTTARLRIIDLESQLENTPYIYTEILQNKSRGGHFVRSSDDIFVYVNPIFEQMLGYETGDLIGKHASIIKASTDQDSINLAKEIRQATDETGTWQGQVQNIRKDGTIIWCDVIVNAFDHHEFDKILMSIYQDITKQKQAEEELLKTVIDAIPDYIFVKDREGRFIISNQAHTDPTRKTSSDELIGKTANDVFPTDIATQFNVDDDKVMSLNQPHISVERPSIDASGNKIWVSSTKIPLRDENQNIIGLVGISRDISEQKQATQAIKQAENRFRMVIETASVAILIIDQAGIILTVNAMVEQLFGYHHGELVGQSVEILLPESLHAIHTEHRADYFANHKVRQMGQGLDLLGQRKDGSEFPLEIGLSYLITDEGIQGIAFITDISHQKQYEADLQRYKNIISSTTDGISLINRDYIYEIVNDAYIELTNSSHDKFEGQPIATVFGEKNFNTIIKPKIDQTLAGKTVNYEEWFDLKSNRRKYIQVTYFPYLNKDEEITGVVVNARDITTIKEAEDERDNKQHIITSILSMIPDIINIVDLDHRKLVFGNTTVIEELGYTESEILKLGSDLIATIMHPDDLHHFQEHQQLLSQIADDEILELEVRIKDKEDNWHWIYSRYTIFKRDIDGIATEVLIISQDITERKELEIIALDNEHLKTQFHKEQEQTAVIQRIISTLSHDMRTPLAVISMSRDMLAQYYDRLSEDRRKEKFDTISHQIQFALRLLDDTVEVARGQHKFNPRLINLAKLCEISLEEAHLPNNINYQLIFKNVGNVAVVLIDETLVSRILLNLLSNAIKYSPNGGEIRIELDYYETGIMLKVSDQGIGIDPDNLPRIFDLLYRANNVSDIKGTGLGLNIVHDCVERHGGIINVQSELGKGSTFTVKLPFEVELVESA